MPNCARPGAGPVAAKEGEEHARAIGISRSTLMRARKKLRVIAERESVGGSGQGRWLWRLPADGEGQERQQEYPNPSNENIETLALLRTQECKSLKKYDGGLEPVAWSPCKDVEPSQPSKPAPPRREPAPKPACVDGGIPAFLRRCVRCNAPSDDDHGCSVDTSRRVPTRNSDGSPSGPLARADDLLATDQQITEQPS